MYMYVAYTLYMYRFNYVCLAANLGCLAAKLVIKIPIKCVTAVC